MRLCLFILVLLGCVVRAHWQLTHRPVHYRQYIVATVNSMPKKTHRYISFYTGNKMLRWYGHAPVVHAGDVWQLVVKLKSVTRSWLLAKEIFWRGYVVKSPINKLISRHRSIDFLRERLEQRIIKFVGKDGVAALIPALTIGSKNFITQQQWQTFRATGTSHLMAISGLHVGLVAGFSYFFGAFFSFRLGLLAAVIAAVVYSVFAGLALPTQRAVIMILIFTMSRWFCRPVTRKVPLAIAFLVVLLFDPLAYLSAGFWLSFVAVASLIYTFSHRLAPANLWWKLGRAQWVVSVALVPWCLWFFQKASLVSLPANVIAIPWVSFVVVPLALLGCFAGKWALLICVKSFDLLWQYLSCVAAWPHALWHHSLSALSMLAAVFVSTLLLAPRGLAVRSLGLVGSILIMYNAPPC